MLGFKNVVFSTIAAALSTGVAGLYREDKGKNEWYREMLGELDDAIVLGDNAFYTLSTNGLLTLFDANRNMSTWKKKLPQGEHENYRLRHIGRNLIAYSD